MCRLSFPSFVYTLAHSGHLTFFDSSWSFSMWWANPRLLKYFFVQPSTEHWYLGGSWHWKCLLYFFCSTSFPQTSHTIFWIGLWLALWALHRCFKLKTLSHLSQGKLPTWWTLLKCSSNLNFNSKAFPQVSHVNSPCGSMCSLSCDFLVWMLTQTLEQKKQTSSEASRHLKWFLTWLTMLTFPNVL